MQLQRRSVQTAEVAEIGQTQPTPGPARSLLQITDIDEERTTEPAGTHLQTAEIGMEDRLVKWGRALDQSTGQYVEREIALSAVRGTGGAGNGVCLDHRNFGTAVDGRERQGTVQESDVPRYHKLLATIGRFEDHSASGDFHKKAAMNLNRWKEVIEGAITVSHQQSSRRAKIELYGSGLSAEVGQAGLGDWGAVTSYVTQKYGETFAILNMANQYAFGGGYQEGMIAQEENVFRRTDCHFSHAWDDPIINNGRRGIYNLEEQAIIGGERQNVYLDVEFPRVCIVGPEDVAETGRGVWTSRTYRHLSDDEVFPFYEMRSAAQDLRRPALPPDNRTRICAQLRTLRAKGVKHAVLSAFGCGAFRNPARTIAQIYREEIERDFRDNGPFFEVIAFAIFYAGYGPASNYDDFAQIFRQ
mmetsp:Transcript_27281/g.54561  ORF Transcript_27281/g.54561 Transcript_27281/m.54561 type:complete len:415 (+) Transcript_27281:306-1550(+)